jgi:hypothetical protein
MSKAETIRRLLLGDLRKIFQHRYGPTLPDDDAGRDDLELLLRLISLSPREGEERMQFQIETVAPWMPATEAADLINNLLRLNLRFRRLSGKEAGKRIRLTNVEREMLKAWRIAPVDMTAVQLNEQRKAKDRARRQLKRAEAGSISRQAYLANAKTKLQPWKANGVSRSTWYRHMRQVRPRQDLTTSGTTCLIHPRASIGGACVCVGNNPETHGQAERPNRPPPSSTSDKPVSRRGVSSAANHGRVVKCTVRRI